ncbi:signal transduction histidine kinase [Microbacterium ginsengiterrae]|uniref:histidine kinase n=1 Tax=Microbacterium ginsengiterrae TaxID=546115 RepID=A0A7W9CEV7_9MICO|nr:signal transduction histidine kinase [Microbacterium ginsengiterrae]
MTAKRQRKQPSTRRRLWARDRTTTMLIVLGGLAVVLYAILVPVHAAIYGAPVAVTMALGLAAVGAPVLSVRFPQVAILLFTVAALLIPLMVSRETSLDAPWPWSVPMLITFAVQVAAITFRHGWRKGLVQFVVGTLAGFTAAVMLPTIPSGNSLIVTSSVVAGIYVLAVLLAGRLRLGDELSRERALTAQEQAKRELVEERTRIARELHDVVAHSMSLIQVQASTARYRVSDLTEEAAGEFDDIASTARSALTEMRRILGVLRTEDQVAELAPQRGIDDIPELVETTRRAGARVSLSQSVSDTVSAATHLTVYRITQEALSNAVRHAPGSPISVTVTADADDVAVTVRNDHDGAPDTATRGHGLRGMNERAELVGGTVSAGPRPDGSWVVAARVPRHPPAPHSEGPQ